MHRFTRYGHIVVATLVWRCQFSLGLLVFCEFGCAAQQGNVAFHDLALATRVIEIDPQGRSVDPSDFPRLLSVEQYELRLKAIDAAITNWKPARARANPSGRKRILVFVHGGLVGEEEALRRAEDQYHEIEKAGYYPIFINWNSEPGSSYSEHLFLVRQGIIEHDAAWSSPLYLAADIGRAFSRAPIVWGEMIRHDAHRIHADFNEMIYRDSQRRWTDNPEEVNTARVTRELLQMYETNPGADRTLPVSLGPIAPYSGGDPWRMATYTLLLPLKLLTAPIIDAGGRAMWENMARRTSIMFEGIDRNELGRSGGSAPAATRQALTPSPGALQRFIDHLEGIVAAAPAAGPDYEITLVGHSMGCMVLNEFVRRSDRFQIDNIVYMGAACSVRDFERTVVPYLTRHPRTHFYNLSLHPANELRERNFQDAIPRGSLLVWIDDFLAEPRTALDRTLGRWDNIGQTVSVIPPTLRHRVHLKAFGLNANADPGRSPSRPGRSAITPQRHSDFSALNYWDPEVWEVSPPNE